jgi:hypothetical protein
VAVSFIDRGNHQSATSQWQTLSHNVVSSTQYTSPWVGFKLTTLVVIGTDCIGTSSCKFNYYTIMTTTSPLILKESIPVYKMMKMSVSCYRPNMLIFDWVSKLREEDFYHIFPVHVQTYINLLWICGHLEISFFTVIFFYSAL